MVVEIVARFGDSVLDVASVTPSGTYRVGTAPGVDLAVELAGLRTFPLIAGGVLRRPVGIVARTSAGPLEATTHRLVLDEPVELAIGPIALTVTLVRRIPVPARPRWDRRLVRYVAGSAIAHVVAAVLVMVLAEPETIGARVELALVPPRPPVVLPDPPKAMRPAHGPAKRAPVKSPQPPPPAVAAEPDLHREPVVEPAPADAPVAVRRERARAYASARAAGIFGSLTAENIRKITGTVDLEKALSNVGPIYREYEATANSFGGGRRFDPTKDDRFASVPTGRYATVSSGRAVGDDYDLPGATKQAPRIELVAGDATIQAAFERGRAALAACYERQPATLEFFVDGGNVQPASGTPIARCVASKLAVAPGHRARFTIRFTPT